MIRRIDGTNATIPPDDRTIKVAHQVRSALLGYVEVLTHANPADHGQLEKIAHLTLALAQAGKDAQSC